jgi:hypothetical protein
MHRRADRTGVCVVRIEVQESGLHLITLVMNPDIDEVTDERSYKSMDVNAAVAAVRQFLVDFTQGETS